MDSGSLTAPLPRPARAASWSPQRTPTSRSGFRSTSARPCNRPPSSHSAKARRSRSKLRRTNSNAMPRLQRLRSREMAPVRRHAAATRAAHAPSREGTLEPSPQIRTAGATPTRPNGQQIEHLRQTTSRVLAAREAAACSPARAPHTARSDLVNPERSPCGDSRITSSATRIASRLPQASNSRKAPLKRREFSSSTASAASARRTSCKESAVAAASTPG